MPPSLPETRSVGEELLDLKNDLVVDEAEEDGDNHPLKDGRGGSCYRENNNCFSVWVLGLGMVDFVAQSAHK